MTETVLSRRGLLGAVGAAAVAPLAAALMPVAARAAEPTALKPQLLQRALAALNRHGDRIRVRETMAIADYAAASGVPRFHLVDVASGRVTSLLVSHGRGSDPGHRGWVERFSNQPGSFASSSGAYAAGDLYVGKHGRSRRLIGLDPANSNAEARAIVVHSAWYVSPAMVQQHGKLGRSEGCFAVSEAELEQVLARLAPGTLLYADKV